MRRSDRNGEIKETQHYLARIDEQPGGFANPANIFDPVSVGKAEVPIEPVADVVSIQHVGVTAETAQLLLDEIGDGRFSRSRKTGEPQNGRPLTLNGRAQAFVRGHRLPMDVGGAPQAKVDHAGAGSGVREAIDHDEAAGIAILRVRIE